MEKRNNKTNFTQIFAISLGIIYITTLMVSTIYSEQLHSESLPTVEIIRLDNTSIPMRYIFFSGGEYCINTIEQVDGPWVNRYVIKQIPVSGIEFPPGILRVEDNHIIGSPLVISADCGQLYEGTEVKIRIAEDIF